MVPHSSPPPRGAPGNDGAASLNRGRPIVTFGKVPSIMPGDQIPPSRDLHAFNIDRDFVGSDVRSPFPALLQASSRRCLVSV